MRLQNAKVKRGLRAIGAGGGGVVEGVNNG